MRRYGCRVTVNTSFAGRLRRGRGPAIPVHRSAQQAGGKILLFAHSPLAPGQVLARDAHWGESRRHARPLTTIARTEGENLALRQQLATLAGRRLGPLTASSGSCCAASGAVGSGASRIQLPCPLGGVRTRSCCRSSPGARRAPSRLPACRMRPRDGRDEHGSQHSREALALLVSVDLPRRLVEHRPE
jgi:hypothetical protein